MTFGLITEGPTDQEVIKHILSGFFKTSDPDTTTLQPAIDATSAKKYHQPGNWDKVLKYCASPEFVEAFEYLDYVILQIDTDWVSQGGHSYKISFNQSDSVEQKIDTTIKLIVAQIGIDNYNVIKGRLIFAIAVDMTECWFLSFHCDKVSDKKSPTNCLTKLNRSISVKHQFTIDRRSKKMEYYTFLSKNLRDHKLYKDVKSFNPSLQIFVNNLKQQVK